MAKYYFLEEDSDDGCWDLEGIKDIIEHQLGLKEKEVYEAKMIKGLGFFYCSKFGEVGETSEGGCGKVCKEYKPRNGKSGRCVHSKNCYEPDKKVLITI